MRKTWVAAMAGALALGSTFMVSIATAEMNERSVTTEKTTTYSGTVSEIDPSSSTITIRSETAPAPTKYVFTKETVFADPQGQVHTH